MVSKNLISAEEKLIQNILFSTNFNECNFTNINFDRFVVIGSSHLILPTLFHNIKKKKISKQFPKDLLAYLDKIYTINHNRNAKLIQEIKYIENLFKKNDIKHIFLKGSNLLRINKFETGERMIGDIDILINKSQSYETIDLLNSKGFKNSFNYRYWKSNVMPNFINNQKLFSLDIHTDLFPEKHKRLSEKFNINFKKRGLNLVDSINYSIYNYQITDFAYLKLNYSYRKLYDIFKLNNGSLSNLKLHENKINFRFKLVLENIGILKKSQKKDIIQNLRFKLKLKIKTFRKLDNFLCNVMIFISRIKFRMIEFILNQKYRIHVLSRLK